MGEKDENLKNDGAAKEKVSTGRLICIVAIVVILLLLGIFAIVKFTGGKYTNTYTPSGSGSPANSRITYVAKDENTGADESNPNGGEQQGSENGNQEGNSGGSASNEGASGSAQTPTAGATGSPTAQPATPVPTAGAASGNGSGGNAGTGNSGSNSKPTASPNQGNAGNSENGGSGNSGNGGSGNSGNGGSGGNKVVSGTPFGNHGKLSVKGANLVDKNGKTFQLKGVSTHGLQWFPQYVNKAAIQSVRDDFGGNVIRLALYTHEGGYCSGGDKAKLKQLVFDGVSYATDLGMYVIIDWHVLQECNPNTYKSEALTFWDEISKKYASYDNVIYEICNEPNGGTSWSTIKSYANEVIAKIRKNDKDAIIIVGTPTWSQDVDQAATSPITGYSNIMYALHFYAGTHKDWLRDRMTAAINKGLPVFVSEYGITDASGNGACDITEANKWVQTMDKYNVSYVCWNLANKNESSCLIKSSVSKTSGWSYSELSTEGKWLVDTLGGKIAKYESGAKKSTTNEQYVGNGGGTGGSGGAGNTQTPTKAPTKAPTKTPTKAPTKAPTQAPQPQKPTQGAVSGNSGKLEATIDLSASWPTGDKTTYQYKYVINNKGTAAKEGWKVTITFSADVAMDQGWNAKYSVNGNTMIIEPEQEWARTIQAGGSFDAGFSVLAPEGVTVKSIVVS